MIRPIAVLLVLAALVPVVAAGEVVGLVDLHQAGRRRLDDAGAGAPGHAVRSAIRSFGHELEVGVVGVLLIDDAVRVGQQVPLAADEPAGLAVADSASGRVR